MTDKEFFNFVTIDLPCALFHVQADDIDDKTGAYLEELILVQMLSKNPEALKYKPLHWFISNCGITNKNIEMSAKLSKEDVISIASSINIDLNSDQIEAVLKLYPSEQEQDPSGTWDLVIEHCIYQIIQ